MSRRPAKSDGDPTPTVMDENAWSQLLQDVALGRLQLSIQTPGGLQIALVSQGELARLQAAAGERSAQPSGVNLSEREYEILTLIADGMTSSNVAARLGLAKNTVSQHLQAARRKLGVTTTQAAADIIRRLDSSGGTVK